MSTESTPRGTQAPAATVTFFPPMEKAKGIRKQLTSWHKFFDVLANSNAPTSANKLDQAGWSPAVFTDDLRKSENVEQVNALVYDFDAGTTTLEQALSVWKGCLACVHSSWSHTPQHPKFRLILVLSRGVAADEFGRCWRSGAAKIEAAGQAIDTSTKDASRLWFLPCRRDDHFTVVIQDGEALDVSELLSGGDASTDLDQPFEPIEAFEANRSYGDAALRGECEAVAHAAEGRRNDQLNRSAFAVGQLVAGGALDAQGATSALLQAASACGLPTEEAERTIRSGVTAGMQKPRPVSTAAPARPQVTADKHAPWEDPQPLVEDIELPAPPWATCLPPVLWQWVRWESIATQTPFDLAALLVLSVLATCGQRRWAVRVKNGWVEPLCLYFAIVLAPGNRKSAVFRAATKPLYDWEAAQRLAIETEMSAATTTVAIAEKKLRAAESRAGKDADMDAMHEALAAARDLAEAQEDVPVIPRLVTADSTQEALAKLLNEQNGCISVMDAEGCGPVALMLGRYADGAAAVDVYLRGHAGDPLRVDRASRDPIIVDNPRVTMGITVQPAVVEQLSERRELRGLGLLARILWSVPQSTVGTRDIDPPSLPAHVEQQYHELIGTLLDGTVPTGGGVATLEVSSEARAVLHVFMEQLEPRLGEDGDLAIIADWASKLAGAVARIAALLHIASHRGAGSGMIVDTTMSAAVSIGNYLLAHARKVLGQTGSGDPVVVDAKAVLHFVRQRKCADISKRDLHQAMRKGYDGRFRQAGDLDAPLSLLAERGWVRLREQREGGGKGRTSVIVAVNPNGNGTPQKAQKPQQVQSVERDHAAVGAIEPIEAFETNRVMEIACVMSGGATFEASATTTHTPVIVYDPITNKPFDVSTPEGEEAYREHLISMV